MTGLYIIPILIVLVLLHELGHLAAARLAGIEVQEFGIGLPPRVLGFRRGGVLYSLNALPIGGFVRVLGEDGKTTVSGSLRSKSKAWRALFFGAGSLMNLLLAVVVITGLAAARGGTTTNVYAAAVEPGSAAAQAGILSGDRILTVAGIPVTGVEQFAALARQGGTGPLSVVLQRGTDTVQTVLRLPAGQTNGLAGSGLQLAGSIAAQMTAFGVTAGTPADQAGLRSGDRFVRFAGRPIADDASLEFAARASAGTTVSVTVQRGDSLIEMQLAVPQAAPGAAPAIGFNFAQYAVTHPLPLWQALPAGLRQTVDISQNMVSGTLSIFTSRSAASGLAGPIGIGQLTSEVLTVSPEPTWVTLARVLAAISLSLSLLNLIPLPALDGGHLLFILVEAAQGHPVPAKREALVHLVGMVALLASMLVIASLDITRIVTGGSFLR